jgi:hypothetical protein
MVGWSCAISGTFFAGPVKKPELVAQTRTLTLVSPVVDGQDYPNLSSAHLASPNLLRLNFDVTDLLLGADVGGLCGC